MLNNNSIRDDFSMYTRVEKIEKINSIEKMKEFDKFITNVIYQMKKIDYYKNLKHKERVNIQSSFVDLSKTK